MKKSKKELRPGLDQMDGADYAICLFMAFVAYISIYIAAVAITVNIF